MVVNTTYRGQTISIITIHISQKFNTYRKNFYAQMALVDNDKGKSSLIKNHNSAN